MNEFAARPEALEPTRPAAVLIPWEDPGQPRLSGLVLTLWDVLRGPGRFFAAMPRQGWAEPLTFGLIVGSFGLMAGSYLELLFSLTLSQKWQALPGLSRVMEKSANTLVVLMIMTPGIILASLSLGSFCLWCVLRLMGVAQEFSPVLRINCYAQGALVAAIIPLLGALAAIVWNVYLTYKGVQSFFKVSPGRALATVSLSLALEALFFLLPMVGLGLFLATRLL